MKPKIDYLTNNLQIFAAVYKILLYAVMALYYTCVMRIDGATANKECSVIDIQIKMSKHVLDVWLSLYEDNHLRFERDFVG